MANQALQVIDLGGSSMLAVPAYLADLPQLVAPISNSGDDRNRIGLKGREFHVFKGGVEEGVLETKHMDVIIVGAAPYISRLYYSAGYQEGVAAAPSCYSVDGNAPASDVKAPQASKCNTCPQNEKGSSLKGDAAGKSKACGFFRRIAVVLAGDPDYTIYQLDCKSQSLWGEGLPQQNKFSFAEYGKKLNAHNIDPGKVITRVTFDPAIGVPVLQFQAVGYIDQEQATHIIDIVQSEQLQKTLEISMNTVDLSGETPIPQPSAPAAAQEPAQAQTATDAPTLRRAAPAVTPARAAPQPVTRPAPVVRQAPAVVAPQVVTAPIPAKAPPAVVERPAVAQRRTFNQSVQARAAEPSNENDVDALIAELDG